MSAVAPPRQDVESTDHDPEVDVADLTTPVSCSVVIPVHNKVALTTQCLDAILADQHPLIKRDVIVVNDGSTDQTARTLLDYAGRIAVITNLPGKGFSGACNVGVAASRGDYVVLLNNDTIPSPGWLAALLAHAEAHPVAGIVGAKLLFPDDTVQHAGVALGCDRFPRHIYIGFPGDHPAVNVSRQFQVVTGACMLVRRTVWDQLGGLDLGYRNGWEDVDFCLRARAAGHEVHYCHRSVLYHLESVSRDVLAPEERANRERYVARWQDSVQPDDFAYYIADGLVTIQYQARYPIAVSISPLLATVTGGVSTREADRLLAERAKQVIVLLRNNILLNTRVQEAEQRMLMAEQRTREAVARLQAADLPAAELATPAAAPSTTRIIGSVEHPAPASGPIREGMLNVSGWALSPFGIGAITALIDGQNAGTLRSGLPRPDVAKVHPGYPNEDFAGFAGTVAVGALAAGEHSLTVRIADRQGRFADAVIPFLVAPPDQVLAVCDRPLPGTRAVSGGELTVSGWALAASPVRRVQAGIGTRPPVDLTIGLPRPDLLESHDYHPYVGEAGFAGGLSLVGLPPGSQQLQLTITTETDGAVTQMVPIVITEDEDQPTP